MNIFILVAIGQLFLTFARGSVVEKEQKRVVCFYFNLMRLQPENIDGTLCTHLVHIGTILNVKTGEILLNQRDIIHNSSLEGHSERILMLKEVNPNLKFLLYVTAMNRTWEPMTFSQRSNIIQSAVYMLNLTKFDGLEILNFDSMISKNSETMADLFCEMKSEFDKHGFTVSTALFYKEHTRERNTIIDKIARCCEFISITDMEFLMGLGNTTTLLSTLTSISSDVDTYLEIGIPANKLLVGIPAFGMAATLKNMNQTGLGASITGSGDNIVPYHEVVQNMKYTSEEWTIQRDEANNAPYAYNKRGQWITYNDVSSVTTMARYVLKKNLGGAALFLLEMDDFQDIGGEGKFPLTRAIHDTFNQGVELDIATSEEK